MWNPFKRKSYDQIPQPDLNKFLRSLYEFTTHSGIATVIPDNQTSYIKNGYAGNDDVYSIINRIIRMSQQARLAVYKIENGKWVEQPGHELAKFTRQVNPIQKTTDFIQGHLIYKLSIGNSYWYKPSLTVGVNKGKTKELYLLPANNVEIIGGANWMSPVGGYRLNHNTTVEFLPNEIYHSKYFNPLFGETGELYGQSPLKAAARVVSKQNEAVLTELKQFENQSPPYILTRKTDSFAAGWTEQQMNDLQDRLKRHASGSKRSSGLLLGDPVEMIKLGVDPVDLNILNSSIEGRRKLCNIYGFPAQLMNDAAATTDNNVQEVRKAAWSDCIIPNLNELAADLTSFLIDPVSEYAGYFFAYDYSEVRELQADLSKQVEWMKKAFWTPNQILEMTGQKPVSNPVMDEPWVSMQEMPLSQATGDLTQQPLLKNFGDYGSK